jgi:histone deacetylase 6
VYVAHDHAAFSPDRIRRVRRKYGKLNQSAYNDLSEMLLEQKDDVTSTLFDMTESWRNEQKQKLKQEEEAVHQQYQQREISVSRSSLPSSMGPFAPIQGTALQYNNRHEEMPVRGSPSASPNPAVLRSPVRLPGLPPMGTFGVTSPDRIGGVLGKRSPEKNGQGSPMMGSPSRGYPRA